VAFFVQTSFYAAKRFNRIAILAHEVSQRFTIVDTGCEAIIDRLVGPLFVTSMTA
jgi:hypothetical protein